MIGGDYIHFNTLSTRSKPQKQLPTKLLAFFGSLFRMGPFQAAYKRFKNHNYIIS